MSLKQKLLTGMASGVGSVLIKTALNVLLIPLLIHTLGLPQFSLYVLLVTLVELSSVLDLGVSGALVKLLAVSQHYSQKTQALLAAGHGFYGLMALLALGAGMILLPGFVGWFHLDTPMMLLAKAAWGWVILEAALSVYTGYYRAVLWAHCQHRWTNVGDTVFTLLSLGGGLILVLNGFDLVTLLVIRCLSAVVRLGMMVIPSVRIQPGVLISHSGVSWPTVIRLYRLSASALTIQLSVLVSHKLDHFVIAALLPLHWVGVYDIVLKFLSVPSQIAQKLGEGALPVTSVLITAQSIDDAKQFFLRMSSLLNASAVLMWVPLVASYPMLFTYFSDATMPVGATWPVFLVSLAWVWSGILQQPANYYLFVSGQERYLAISSALTACINLGLTILLTPSLGLLGVALGTLIPQLIQHQAFSIRTSCQRLGISWLEYMTHVHGQALVPTLVCSFIMGGVFFMSGSSPIPFPILICVAGVSGIMGVLAWLWVATNADERARMWRYLTRRFPPKPQVAVSS